jgi:hypothetical protein
MKRRNQSHVVIERQPADTHVFRSELDGFSNGTNVGEEIGVRERDAFRIAGGTGRVLQERDVAGFASAGAGQMRGQRAGSRRRSFVRGVEKFFGVNNAVERADARLKQFGDGFGAAERQKQADAGVVEDGGLAIGVFFDSICAKGRIDRDGNCAREQNPRVRNKKRARGGKHERNTAAGRNATARELGGTALSSVVKLRESQPVRFVARVGILGNVQMDALGVVDGAIAKNLDQCLPSEDTFIRGMAMEGLHFGGGPQGGRRSVVRQIRGRRGQDCGGQLFGSVDFRRHAIGKAHAEFRFQASEQFYAFEAAQAKLAIQMRFGAEHRKRAFTAQFGEQRPEDLEYALADGQ